MTERRRLAHQLRNDINLLVLTTQCLRISEGDEVIECIDTILTTADSAIFTMDQLEALPEEPSATPPTP